MPPARMGAPLTPAAVATTPGSQVPVVLMPSQSARTVGARRTYRSNVRNLASNAAAEKENAIPVIAEWDIGADDPDSQEAEDAMLEDRATMCTHTCTSCSVQLPEPGDPVALCKCRGGSRWDARAWHMRTPRRLCLHSHALHLSNCTAHTRTVAQLSHAQSG